MKKTVALLLAVLMSLGVFSGCRQEEAPYTPTGAGLTWDEDYTGPRYEREEEKVEQELHLTFYADRTMNPYTCTDYTNRALFTLIYQSLFSVDRNYEAEPQLCKKYSVSADLKTYTIYLENAVFTDGTPLTAQDVLTSLQTAKESDYYSGRFRHIKEMSVTGDGAIQITTAIGVQKTKGSIEVGKDAKSLHHLWG